MPYRSDVQRRWAHTRTGTKALGGKAKVAEWDEDSGGKNLPERVNRVAGKKGVEKLARAAAEAHAKTGQHRMPDGHMMSDKEMQEMTGAKTERKGKGGYAAAPAKRRAKK